MLLLKNAKIFTMGPQGVLERGDILLENGKIAAVGEAIDASCEQIDLTGMTAVPGLVDAHSHIGGFRMDGSMEADLNELTAPVTAELNSYYGVQPDDPAFQGALTQGITTSCVIPGSGNVIGGWGIVVKSAGDSFDERVIKNPAVLKAAVGINPKGVYAPRFMRPMTRMAIAQLLREYLFSVQDYMEKKEKAEAEGEKTPAWNEAMEHGIPVLKRQIPLKVHSYQHDMLTVLRIADEFDIDVTLDHAQGATDFLEEIASNKHVRGVIYGPITMGVFPGEGCKIDYDAPMKLEAMGVTCAVMTDGPVTNAAMLVNQTGEVVRAGMDPLKALKLITINPAKILGCDDRVGSIEVGKDGDIAVFTGQPALDAAAKVVMTLSDGRVQYKA